MVEQQQKLILSPYMDIYELVIPKDNLLRQIKELVDFGFIYEELIDKYCLDNGRSAVPPVRMFKYLLLKSIYDLSDIDVVERSKYDMSFKYFLDMAPEEKVINPSSLTKFRKLRLRDMNLLDMLIAKTVRIALEKGIIKSKSIIVDATHTKSRYNQKTPRQALLEQSKKRRRAIYEIDESMKEQFPAKNTEDSLEKELEYYYVEDIPDDQLGYIVTEDFLAPVKGIPLVQRLYHDIFDDPDAAQHYAKNLKLHDLRYPKSIVTFLVCNRQEVSGQPWYQNEKEAMRLMTEKGQAHLDNSFCIFTKNHIEKLKKLPAKEAV